MLALSGVHAQPYPSKPIRLVVPFSTGTSTDVLARLYAQKLGDSFGQTIIVENKAGAGGNIAGEAVARAAPDGYTLTISNSAVHATNPALYGKLPICLMPPPKSFRARLAFAMNSVGPAKQEPAGAPSPLLKQTLTESNGSEYAWRETPVATEALNSLAPSKWVLSPSACAQLLKAWIRDRE